MDTLPVFSGSKVSKGDPRYETLIRGFNLRWVGAPRFVQVVGDARQVRESVQRALWHDIRITVRGDRHWLGTGVTSTKRDLGNSCASTVISLPSTAGLRVSTSASLRSCVSRMSQPSSSP